MQMPPHQDRATTETIGDQAGDEGRGTPGQRLDGKEVRDGGQRGREIAGNQVEERRHAGTGRRDEESRRAQRDQHRHYTAVGHEGGDW